MHLLNLISVLLDCLFCFIHIKLLTKDVNSFSMSVFSKDRVTLNLIQTELRVIFHQGSYNDKFRKVVSWFSLRQDVSETLLKKWGH